MYDVYVWANRQAESDPGVAETARQIFSKMESGDPDALSTWELFRRVSVEDLHRIYDRLNVSFDEFHGESMYGAEKCCEIVEALEQKGLLETLPDGRKVCEAKRGQKLTIVKSDGSMMYLSRDIAGAIERHAKYNFTRMYYVVENGQSDHFMHLFGILDQLGYDWVQGLKHIKFGRVQGMSSRKGTAVFLQDLLDEAQEVMLDKQEETESEYGIILVMISFQHFNFYLLFFYVCYHKYLKPFSNIVSMSITDVFCSLEPVRTLKRDWN